jgi:transporter family protein
MTGDTSWFYWALWSAAFAALTAIFAKLGLEGVDSDLATLVRTSVIIVVLAGFVYATGKWSNPLALSPTTWLFLVLSGLATGASWVCYFRALKAGDASKVAPIDKLSRSWWRCSRSCSSGSGPRRATGSVSCRSAPVC